VGYSAYVPELPTILVNGRSDEELTDRAAEAIRLYWQNVLIIAVPPDHDLAHPRNAH
jgi:predicted RNase H-like HicB family nuclease